jgi:hypothetical protein
MWAFFGNPYNLTIINRAAGEGQSLTKDGSNVVMRDGEYAWELFGNSDGFVLRAPGTANDWVNQNGGASGPLQFWVSANGKTDNGSTFRVTEAPDPDGIEMVAGHNKMACEIYNLAGQRITNSQMKRGIYIIDGRKVLVK